MRQQEPSDKELANRGRHQSRLRVIKYNAGEVAEWLKAAVC
jgi:hypothetical protein